MGLRNYLLPLQQKPANCFSICFAILGLKFSLAPYSHYFFGLCKEPNNKNAESAAAAAAATHYYWPTHWRIFSDLALLLLQQQQQQMGFVFQLPKFCQT
jgi:hypothetical protein